LPALALSARTDWHTQFIFSAPNSGTGKIRKISNIVDGLLDGSLQVVSSMETNTRPRVFFVADLNAKGELRHITEYDYVTLERIPGASELIGCCSGALWKSPEEAQFVLSDEHGTWLRWRSTAVGTGIATVRRAAGDLVSISLLASGLTLESEATTLGVFQQHLVRELRQTPFEPAFDLLQLTQRPLLATMTFLSGPGDKEHMVEALADRAFAAAYFRYLQMA